MPPNFTQTQRNINGNDEIKNFPLAYGQKVEKLDRQSSTFKHFGRVSKLVKINLVLGGRSGNKLNM